MSNTWGFYGRLQELTEIERIISSDRWFFCAISGRRRIGKTTLIQRAVQSQPGTLHFYFRVPDSDERGVVQAFQEAYEDFFATGGIDADEALKLSQSVRTFAEMVRVIGVMCDRGMIVTIDEFQYFHRKALYPFTSYLQAEVDRLRDTGKGGLFVLGSIHTEMTAVLEDQASPLFNRVTDRIGIGHWDFATLFEMFDEHHISSPAQQLFLWSLFEGVPKFYRDCFDQGLLRPAEDYRKSTLQRLFFEGSSPLRDEADNWFLRELRGRYDSILKILANSGPCSHGELKSEYNRAGSGGETQFGGYLATLIERYGMVEKQLPVFATTKARKARYIIADNFLSAWLNAIARNVQLSRVQPLDIPVARCSDMLEVLEGITFEKMIRQLTEEASRIGVGGLLLSDIVHGYWNKPDGSDVEIDLVALDEEQKLVRFGSCKRSQARHDDKALRKFDKHIERFLRSKEGRRLTGWKIEKAVYAPRFDANRRDDHEQNGYICLDLNDFKNQLYG